MRKSLWTFAENRIAVRFQYECRSADGQWWRSYGNENWEFDAEGLMVRREASINDLAITESERRIHGPRPESERGVDIPLQGTPWPRRVATALALREGTAAEREALVAGRAP